MIRIINQTEFILHSHRFIMMGDLNPMMSILNELNENITNVK